MILVSCGRHDELESGSDLSLCGEVRKLEPAPNMFAGWTASSVTGTGWELRAVYILEARRGAVTLIKVAVEVPFDILLELLSGRRY